jgi:hypothetical protein
MLRSPEFRYLKAKYRLLRKDKQHTCETNGDLGVILKAQGYLEAMDNFDQNIESWLLEQAAKEQTNEL